jgi:hypothetical protein
MAVIAASGPAPVALHGAGPALATVCALFLTLLDTTIISAALGPVGRRMPLKPV